MEKTFYIEKLSDGVALVAMDLPREKVNKFSTPVMEELAQLLEDLQKQKIARP